MLAGPSRALAALVAAAALAACAVPVPVAGQAAPSVPVIVQAAPGAVGAAADLVVAMGGQVTEPLPIVDGFGAVVPADRITALGAHVVVRAVTPDAEMHVQGAVGREARTPRSVHTSVVGADGAWAEGISGAGVTVALIDTGVAAVDDLAGRVVPVTDDVTGQVAPCVNLSGEAGCADSYGHGTFMAGLIAGTGAASGGAHRGVAPGARILSVKIAGRDGSADVSNVLAAIQWVVSFRDRYDIRVLNLSLGTDSTQTYEVDPLNYAVERAWAAGIAVVVSASNRGPTPGTIAKPGDDPWVITVGATDDRGTVGLGDDRVPDFSSRGPTAAGLAKPDISAPGADLVSLRAPGSAIDQRFPPTTAGAYRQGSGTSMATAVVAGVAALLIDADPSLTPDGLKHALVASARPAASSDRMAVGAGVVHLGRARQAPPGRANVGLARSNGLGSLDASRGTVRVSEVSLLGTLLAPSHTAQLLLWDPLGFVTGDWSSGTWSTTTWSRGSWYATRWYGSNWHGSNWHGSNWHGEHDPSSWYGSNWHGSTWYGAWS